MADVLSITAFVAFFAVMVAFVFLYDRSAGYGGYDGPSWTQEGNGRDERGARPA
jgi:hypothetical protein